FIFKSFFDKIPWRFRKNEGADEQYYCRYNSTAEHPSPSFENTDKCIVDTVRHQHTDSNHQLVQSGYSSTYCWSRNFPHIHGNQSGSGAYGYAEDKRSEEHTSELQTRFDLVCRLLLEKKKHLL